MQQFCFTINGQRHCFNVPSLIDSAFIHKPPINNLPPFELAVSVLQLVEAVPHSALSAELSQVAHRYIQQIKNALPAGVELINASEAAHAAKA